MNNSQLKHLIQLCVVLACSVTFVADSSFAAGNTGTSTSSNAGPSSATTATQGTGKKAGKDWLDSYPGKASGSAYGAERRLLQDRLKTKEDTLAALNRQFYSLIKLSASEARIAEVNKKIANTKADIKELRQQLSAKK